SLHPGLPPPGDPLLPAGLGRLLCAYQSLGLTHPVPFQPLLIRPVFPSLPASSSRLPVNQPIALGLPSPLLNRRPQLGAARAQQSKIASWCQHLRPHYPLAASARLA